MHSPCRCSGRSSYKGVIIMYQDNFFRELVVDNFAGGGGASTGIELALGYPVDIAVNHDGDAVAMHKINHPYTQHFQEDVFAIDPERVTGGRPVGIAWFSPDCKHFSRAKGGKPVDKKIRGLSWVVLKWAMSSAAPRVIFMENVPEIKTWCPLIDINGIIRPDPQKSGETFNGFVAMLTTGIAKTHPAFSEACEFLNINHESDAANRLSNGLGYKVVWKELRACDYGAPTIRKRFYLVARRDGQPIIFPQPTHGNGLKPYRTAAECIDWSIPRFSIFNRKKPLVENTLKRIARGLEKFVIRNPKPFIMQMDFENTSQNVDAFISTIKAAYISKYFSGEKQSGVSIQQPLSTVTGIGHNALVETHLCILRNNMDCKALDEPLPTLTTSAGHFAQITTYIQKYTGFQELRKWDKVRKLLNDYAGYSIADDEILILEINGNQYFIADICMRMLRARELMLAQGFPSDYIIDIESHIGKKYSEAKQVARMGNAVCPPVAEALVRANCAEMVSLTKINSMQKLKAIINDSCNTRTKTSSTIRFLNA